MMASNVTIALMQMSAVSHRRNLRQRYPPKRQQTQHRTQEHKQERHVNRFTAPLCLPINAVCFSYLLSWIRREFAMLCRRSCLATL